MPTPIQPLHECLTFFEPNTLLPVLPDSAFAVDPQTHAAYLRAIRDEEQHWMEQTLAREERAIFRDGQGPRQHRHPQAASFFHPTGLRGEALRRYRREAQRLTRASQSPTGQRRLPFDEDEPSLLLHHDGQLDITCPSHLAYAVSHIPPDAEIIPHDDGSFSYRWTMTCVYPTRCGRIDGITT